MVAIKDRSGLCVKKPFCVPRQWLSMLVADRLGSQTVPAAGPAPVEQH
jgi:hypothetical protein